MQSLRGKKVDFLSKVTFTSTMISRFCLMSEWRLIRVSK